jgi:uncharacterized protein (UPF0303 family)
MSSFSTSQARDRQPSLSKSKSLNMLQTLSSPTRNLNDLAQEEKSFTFAHFTCEHAWVIGNILRNALRTASVSAVIHISLSSNTTLFHAPSLPGTMPDAETWTQRKRNAVLRWGHSTWYIGCQFDGDYKRFAEYHAMSGDEWSKYTIEGGGYPVFVKGVDGVVGSIVVVGADMDGTQAHGIVVRAIEEYKDLREGFRSPMRRMTVK